MRVMILVLLLSSCASAPNDVRTEATQRLIQYCSQAKKADRDQWCTNRVFKRVLPDPPVVLGEKMDKATWRQQ